MARGREAHWLSADVNLGIIPMDQANERRYQVFVSSTFVDLQEERRKALDAILEAQAFPAGMELFPSADDDQFEFIKREIESSDYYIVIVAGRYGSLAPDGLSFTEKEYDYALSLTKPVMAFLHKDLGELRGKALEPEQAQRERLQAFRAKVSAGKLVKFYSNPDELKAQVAQALNSAFRLKPQIGWVRATNARRIEDLEEIMRLQKQVMELEAEVKRLAYLDPRKLLTHDEQDVGLDFALAPLLDQGADQRAVAEEPPFARVRLSYGWDEVLALLFRPEEQRVERPEIVRRLTRSAAQKLALQDAECKRWSGIIVRSGFVRGFERTPIDEFVKQVSLRLRGCGYVFLGAESAGHDPDWILTQDGITRLAIIHRGSTQAGLKPPHPS